jgi:hypothetical protein
MNKIRAIIFSDKHSQYMLILLQIITVICLFGCAPNLDEIQEPVLSRSGQITIYHDQKLKGRFLLNWQHDQNTHLISICNSQHQKLLQIRIQDQQLTLATLKGTYYNTQARKKIKEVIGINLDWAKWSKWFSQSKLSNTVISGFKVTVTNPNTKHPYIQLSRPPITLTLKITQ